MDAQWILTFVGGYVATAVLVFLLYSPFLVLYVVLLLLVGFLQLIALSFLVLFRRLRWGEGSRPHRVRSGSSIDSVRGVQELLWRQRE